MKEPAATSESLDDMNIAEPSIDINASQHQRINIILPMRTTLTLEDDVYEAAQSMAQASGKRLGEVVSLLMRRGLKGSGEVVAGRSGLPVFPAAPGAPIIPGNRAHELLAEEVP
jgi:hypothetical protein